MEPAESEPNAVKPKSCRSRRRWALLLAAVAVLVLLLGLTFHYRCHLLFRLGMARGDIPDVKAIPAGPMPDTPDPKGWTPCSFGSLRFDLPPAMASGAATPPTRMRSGRHMLFHDGSKSVIVSLPEDTRDSDELLLSKLKLPPQGRGLSMPRLRLACCQVGTSDFRWSMSAEEVSWHVWRVCMSPTLRSESDGAAETLFRSDLDGILMLAGNRRHAIFNWQTAKKPLTGFLFFKDSAVDLDPIWVRSVCKSVRLIEEPTEGQRRPN
jgi:hypothetical protein